MKWIWVLILCNWATIAHADKTFVYCSEAGPSVFNPQLADDGPTFNASAQMIYNRLVEFAPGSTQVVPGLAEKWDVSRDGKTYTFHLRQGVHFQTTESFRPTRDFNADDVLFSFERALKKDHPYHLVNGGNYLYFESLELAKIIRSIDKVDDHTVRFNLNWAEAPFVANLGMDFAVILSAEYADQLLRQQQPQKIDFEPVGTGPFLLKRFVKDNSIRYAAHPTYWRGRAKLDQVVFAITPDASVRLQKLKTGECQLMAEPAPQDLAAIRAQPQLQLMQKAGANVGYLAFNVERSPFDKPEVREAIVHALNRQSYIELVYGGTALVAHGPLPPSVWGFDQGEARDTYDPELAKSLLRKAGFEKGFNAEIWTLPVARPYNPNGKKMGELMQADLAKVGIQVQLVTYDWPTYLARSRAGAFTMAQFGWTTDNGDPDNFLGVLLTCAGIKGGGNVSRWCNSSYDQLVTRAKKTFNREKRAADYKLAQAAFRKSWPWVPLAHATVSRGLSRRVTGYQISPFGVEDFYPLDLN